MSTQTHIICDTNMDEFNKPVESIMRCENFKSNFARRLSNRYTSKSAIALKADSTMTLHLVGSATEQNLPKSPVLSVRETRPPSPTPATVSKPPKVMATAAATTDSKCVEVTALAMEVETLRWQLAQTETNRQMHLALLQQIVSFLNRVKEHMVCQSSDLTPRRETAGESPRPVDLPRSRSVLHVSRHQEYSLSPVKKLSTRKMSKSITNVNGLRDLPWNESKLSLNRERDLNEKDAADKIVQEISRLISLANSVLSTKIPDLSYSCNDLSNCSNEINQYMPPAANGDGGNYDSDKSANNNNCIAKSNECEINSPTKDVVSNTTNTVIDCDLFPNEKLDTEFPIMSKLGCKLSMVKADDEPSSPPPEDIQTIDIKSQLKNRDYGHVTSFIEDESGFSSMSSFQEIGIPIINIIPPTPCKDISFTIRDLELIDGGDGKWKPGALELDKHTMQVFWV